MPANYESINDLLGRRSKWWREERSTLPCVFDGDGALVAYNLADIKTILDRDYPYDAERGVWYFNETKDRELAELHGQVVICNPQVYWRHTQIRD